MINWGAPIWIYLWLGGMAAGAYFVAFLDNLFTRGASRQMVRWATYSGIPLIGIGLILLLVDLGQPTRFWHLLASFRVLSPMSIGTWILLVWEVLAVIMTILWRREQPLALIANKDTTRSVRGTRILSWFEFIFSVLVMAYTGVLLAISNQPLWAGTVLLPSLFVASATSTGVALLIISSVTINTIDKGELRLAIKLKNHVIVRLKFGLTKLKSAINLLFNPTEWTVPRQTVDRLVEVDVGVILIEIAVLVGYAICLGNSTMVGASEALKVIIIGALAAPFWVGVVLLALLIPLVFDVANRAKDIDTGTFQRVILTSSVCVILGGLILRAVIVIAGQL